MRKFKQNLFGGAVVAVLLALGSLLTVPLWSQSPGPDGVFFSLSDYAVAGEWTFKDADNPIKLEGVTDDAFETTLLAADPTADRTLTFPDATDTVVTLAATQTLTNKTINGATIDGGVTFTVRSPTQNVDNGAASTVDHVIIVPQSAATITAIRVIYTEETAGTIAAGTWQVGTAVAGSEVVAAVAYTNSATVGTETVGTIVSGAVGAGTPVIWRHTGVAATAAGVVYIEVDLDYD